MTKIVNNNNNENKQIEYLKSNKIYWSDRRVVFIQDYQLERIIFRILVALKHFAEQTFFLTKIDVFN